MRPGPFQYFKVATPGSKGTRLCIPWALIRPGPFQYIKVTTPGSKGTRLFIPWALMRPGPFQQFKMAIPGSICTCITVPRYTEPSQVLHYLKMPIQCRICNCIFIQQFLQLITSFLSPFKYVQLPISCSCQKKCLCSSTAIRRLSIKAQLSTGYRHRGVFEAGHS